MPGNIYGRKMFRMANGGMMPPVDPAMMAGAPPMAPPMDPAMAGGEMDPAVLEGLLSDASQTTGDLEQAEDFDSLLSGMTGGDVTSVEQTRSELAAIVGPEDAEKTPESVLTLVQPVLMMASADQGIGPLAQDAMSAPVSDPTMTQGLASMPGMV